MARFQMNKTEASVARYKKEQAVIEEIIRDNPNEFPLTIKEKSRNDWVQELLKLMAALRTVERNAV